ncbi:MAG: hypothetical protein KJ626_11130, partial [Verrucomicrobia bacterium]|nr:hypothetical protein [Verrucomicrobiota bacterium]
KAPSAELAKARVETLRKYRWSSFRAYAGYEKPPKWLSTKEVLGRVKGKGRRGYTLKYKLGLAGGYSRGRMHGWQDDLESSFRERFIM